MINYNIPIADRHKNTLKPFRFKRKLRTEVVQNQNKKEVRIFKENTSLAAIDFQGEVR
jgi:hypothetical protein